MKNNDFLDFFKEYKVYLKFVISYNKKKVKTFLSQKNTLDENMNGNKILEINKKNNKK